MPGARGEGVIHLADRDVYVLYTNRALMDAERQIGKSILDVLDGFTRNTSGITELAHLLLAGMRAARRDMRTGGPAVRLEDALAVMDEAGFAAVATVVMEAVAAVLSYGGGQEENPNP